MGLTDALQLKNKEMICFVGAGGKTSLMTLLARECAAAGARVLVTTSTKMYYRQLRICSPQILLEKEQDLLSKLKEFHAKTPILAVAAGLTEEQKATGLSKECLDEIYRSGLFDYVLVEADGSRGKSMKAPAEYEPVVPSLATTVLAVVGLDILGRPLSEETVHRASLAVTAAAQRLGEPVTETTVVRVFRYYEQKIREATPSVQFTPVLNKVDFLKETDRAKALAMQLLTPSVRNVLLTSAVSGTPVLEVIK
ncbi:MAG: selenium cofactor biosynthesis protein YqeC [Bacillota bacterium]|nr:selenium cofactor biosynthesis protein YqeC [Bacillota bacterium]